jgi:dTDP-glucose 4,6-dehydratase
MDECRIHRKFSRESDGIIMKRVLLTGAAGFIGHHVLEHLLRTTDCEVVCLDRLDYSGNLNRIEDIMTHQPHNKSRVKIVHHDLRADINPLVSSFVGKCDTILHLAAGSHVDRSITYPMEFVQDNVIGTANLLEFARRSDSLEQFLYFSTDEVFGPAPDGINYKERDRYNSTNPYSATKAAGEELCVAYENTYKMPVKITHTMNVFGERQTPEKFIPMCIRRIRDGESVSIHSNPEKDKAGSRYYIHANDVAAAVCFIVQNDLKSDVDYGGAKCPKFNVVGKEEIDNLSLAKMIAKAQNKELLYEMVDFHSTRPGHDLRYALSGDVLRAKGWEPKVSITDRISEVTAWYLANNKWLDL